MNNVTENTLCRQRRLELDCGHTSDGFTTRFAPSPYIPTAYDPTDVAFSADGSWIYIVNGKNDTGPNPLYGYGNMGVIKVQTDRSPRKPMRKSRLS